MAARAKTVHEKSKAGGRLCNKLMALRYPDGYDDKREQTAECSIFGKSREDLHPDDA